MRFLNELLKIFAPVFGGAVSGGIWVYGVIEETPIIITIGCILFAIEIICNFFLSGDNKL